MKLRAVRSPVRTARAGPAISKITLSAVIRSPSVACQVSAISGSNWRKVASTHGRPQRDGVLAGDDPATHFLRGGERAPR